MSTANSAAHNEVTIALSKKESAELMIGMEELCQEMKKRPLSVKAFALDDPSRPSNTNGSTTVKTVHFVRHGQGFHNLMADIHQASGKEWTQYVKHPNNPYTAPEITDAPLTDKGRLQAYLLQEKVRAMESKPELVVLSPLCRALQTGVMAFEELISSSAVFIAHEMVREESGAHICDKRRHTSRQRAEFPQVDFSLLTSEEDPLYSETRRETKVEIGERIYKFLEWLSQREETHVAVASHSGWLLTLFNGVLECSNDNLQQWFQTGEMRSVVLEFSDKQ